MVTLRNDIIATDRASGVFRQVAKSVDDLDKRQQSFAKGMAAAFSTTAVLAFAKDSIQAFAEAEAAQAKLEQAYRKFPSMASANIGALREMNQALQDKTGADADSLAAAQASLAMFKLTGDQIRQLTPLLVDYAQVTGQDVGSAATALGKAMTGNAKALKAIGINFKATGDTAADFATIMAGLQEKVGGAGEAFGQTTAGQLQITQRAFEDLQEAVGEALVPALRGAADGMRMVADAAPELLHDIIGLGDGVKTLKENLTGLQGIQLPSFDLGLPDWMTNSGGGEGPVSTIGDLVGVLNPWKQAVDSSNEAGARFNARLEEMGYVFDKTTGQVRMATGGGEGFGAAMDDAADSVDGLRTAFAGLSGLLSRQDALDNQTAAWQKLAASIKENGPAFTGTTAAALDNREALRNAWKATIDLASGYQGATAKTAVLKGGIAQMRATLAASGLSPAEINKLLAPYQQQITKAEALKTAINNIPSQKEINIRTTYTTIGTGPNASKPLPVNASGGAVRGPGTGTSDSILSWLSNGEYVVKAAAVEKYGVAMFDSLNAMSFKSGGLAQQASAAMKTAGQQASAIRAAQKVEKSLVRLGLSGESLSRLEQMDPALRLRTDQMLIKGGRKSVRQFNSTTSGLNADQHRADAARAAQDAAAAAAQKAQQEEESRQSAAQQFAAAAQQAADKVASFGSVSTFDVKGQAQATQDLADAEKALFEARRKANMSGSAEDLQAVADAEAKVGAARKNAADKAVTAANIIANMRNRGAQISRFRSVIERLKAAGLNGASLSEIIAMGPEDGTTLGEALLAGGAGAIGDANSLQSAMGMDSAAVGAISAAIEFGSSPGIEGQVASYVSTPGGGQTVTVNLTLDGQTIQTSLLRLRRTTGAGLGLG